MTEEPKRRPGRPATGHAPTRSVRIGPIWDEAVAITKTREGESVNAIIEAALRRYVARHRRTS